jgi:hypothetical protein
VERQRRGKEVVQCIPGRRSGKGPIDESEETVRRLADHLATDLLLVLEMEVEASLVNPGGGKNLADTGRADPLALDQAARLAQNVIARPFPFCRHGSTPV